jgi:hypothetical protein
MNIVVIVSGERVKEVIVPDASVKVVVLDLDDPCGSDTIAISEHEEAALDAAAYVRQTVDAVRLNKLLQAVKAGLADLPDSKEVQTVRALIQEGYPRA